MTNIRTHFLLIILLLLVTASALQAQVSITTLGPAGAYTQNFDGLGTANFSLTDNTSITGVYAFRAAGNAVPNVFSADAGTTANGQFKNYGTAAAADRTLGSLSSGTPGTLNYGVRFVNNTGTAIASLQITYTGEQWRDNGNATPQLLTFDYRQAATVTDLTTGIYLPVATLNFTTPVNSGGSAALDGNAAGNRTAITASFLVAIPVGEEIMIRWTDLNDAGTDHGIGIDDLSVIARAAPTAASATLSGRVATANGRGIGKAYVTLSGGNLTSPLRAITNPFGYYIFPDLAVGQTYVLSVNSKLFRFTQHSRTVSLIQDAAAIDFVAEQ
jgi:hypothetical protein